MSLIDHIDAMDHINAMKRSLFQAARAVLGTSAPWPCVGKIENALKLLTSSEIKQVISTC